mmetsp:Transcript_15086/g.40716  ORF Transcript_15086/g.40716 Transcript_15086/m.40716 type:complete len:314 (-) Transcript_15086:2516-3457(-)
MCAKLVLCASPNKQTAESRHNQPLQHIQPSRRRVCHESQPDAISQCISSRNPKKSSRPSSGQPSIVSSSSNFGFLSPMIATPKDLMSLRTASLGKPLALPSGTSFPSSAASSAYSCFLAKKISRNCSTSFCENLIFAISFCMRSSSACWCSVSNILDSCTNVQNLIVAEPSGPVSATPASLALCRAVSNFFIRACCSSLDFGSQPKTCKIPRSSKVSISPPWSLSKRSKRARNSSIRSSVKPAFFRSFVTRSARQASTKATKGPNSIPFAEQLCLSIKAWGGSDSRPPIANTTFLLGNLPVLGSTCSSKSADI